MSTNYDFKKLRSDPGKDDEYYESMAMLATLTPHRTLTLSPMGFSPRARQMLARGRGEVFVPTLEDFCPVNPELNPRAARKWIARHSLQEFIVQPPTATPPPTPPATKAPTSTSASASEHEPAERPAQPKQNRRSKKKHHVRVCEEQDKWKRKWKSCITQVIKQNREDRLQTALNRVDGRCRELKREKCKEIANAKTERPYTPSGLSHKSNPPKWADATPSLSEKSKKNSKKVIGLDAQQQHEDALQDKEAARIATQIENRKNLKKAYLIGGS